MTISKSSSLTFFYHKVNMDEQVRKRERRRSFRIRIEVKTKIVVQLFGASSQYEFETVNMSESGMLLRSTKNKIHFNKQSILEVWITPQDSDRIFFIAKFIRSAPPNMFAIQVTEIDLSNSNKLRDLLESSAPSK